MQKFCYIRWQPEERVSSVFECRTKEKEFHTEFINFLSRKSRIKIFGEHSAICYSKTFFMCMCKEYQLVLDLSVLMYSALGELQWVECSSF